MARGNEGVLFPYREDGEIQLKIDYKAVLPGTGIFLPLLDFWFPSTKEEFAHRTYGIFVLLSIIKCNWLNECSDCGGH